MKGLEERAKKIAEALPRYTEMELAELEELYDDIEILYNELRHKYIDALVDFAKNKELAESIIKKTVELLLSARKDIVAEMTLIGLLNVIATGIHDRLVGYLSISVREESN